MAPRPDRLSCRSRLYRLHLFRPYPADTRVLSRAPLSREARQGSAMPESSRGDAGEPLPVGTGATWTGPQVRLAPQRPVSPRFVVLYASAYVGTILLFLAPLLVSLSLKVNALVGTERAPNNLSLVAGTGAFLAMFANPFFGRMSDRTASRLGMRRPWMMLGLLGGSPRDPRGSAGTEHRGRPDRLVHRLGVPQCPARSAGGRSSRSGPCRPTRSRRGRPGHLPADRLGEWHVRRPALHRQHPGNVHGSLRDRWVFRPALRRDAAGSPPGRRGQAGLVGA